MKIKSLVGICAVSASLVACGGGDIKIDAANNSPIDNSVAGDQIVNSNNQAGDGEPSTGSNPCASYIDSSVTRQGSYDAATGHCTYGTDFVSLSKPYDQEEDLTLNDLPNDGVHVFNGSLVIGKNYSSNADLSAAGIAQGGDGSVLRIEAGATLAFRSSDDYFVINRGSQMFAEGAADAPITVTSTSDAVDGSVAAEADGEWGGMLINGFGITNKCEYTGTMGVDIALATGEECHVEAEGKAGAGQTHYGGDNNADNSGILNYFIVKHTGAEVAPENELNGISFNTVGSGTTVDYLQAYSTLDDGVEMFGGAVNISHYVALYVRDDSIDIDEGYQGTFDYALVIQSETFGNQCVESDGIGSYSKKDAVVIDDYIARGLNSRATIRNLTCIISPSDQGTRGNGAGLRVREAHFPTIENAIVTTAYGADAVVDPTKNEHSCVRIENAGATDLAIVESVFGCSDVTKGDLDGASTLDWLNANSNDTMATNETGENPSFDDTDVNIALFEANSFYSLALGDMVVNGGAVTVTPTESRTFIGAVTSGDDWTAGWAYGLDPSNRGQALWFE
ncbi:serine/threonine protein kinase [Teredinibacter haidensis]|uniref:serine/threonine protein kinase n=1 Tax=Teredinibacter haidensis TaxID=2731755 RepID=UPI0009489C5F|nr:serine/threonine protein kinase [Teredinibacter haidensis]